MINVIYGLKGSGKTQRIIDAVNWRAATTKGKLVYITNVASHSKDVDNSVRFVDVSKSDIRTEREMVAFIKGILAANYDVTDVYIDGLARFIGKNVEEMEEAFTLLDLLSSDSGVSFTLTVSVEEVPQFMRKYL